jgi:hypothetical protein
MILMKKILLAFLIALECVLIRAQAPEGFSYYAIVRDGVGNPVPFQAVSFRFNILRGTPAGTSVYSETHDVTTDAFGSVSLVIGFGTVITGNFPTISWGIDKYFLKVELDNTGGTTYVEMSTSQLLSVPYALYSKTAGNGFSGNYNDLTNKPITNGSETKILVRENLEIEGAGTPANPYILNTRGHFIGEKFGGGIVFYVYDNRQHGLIAASTDQYNGIVWFNGIKKYTNTTGDGLKSGEMNTSIIIATQTNDNPMGNFAAKVCADYSVTVDGVMYGDWYLPSKHELFLMYIHKEAIGSFKNDYYWSSTEFSSISAWSQNFFNGSQFNLNKSLPYSVRAIRAF